MAPVDFSGTWKQVKTENLEEWLKAMDVNMVKRAAMTKVTPSHVIQQDGDSFKVKVTGPMGMSHEEDFTVGQEHATKLPMGLKVKGTPKWDGEKLVIEAIPEDDPSTPLSTIREMVGDEMVMTATRKGVTCKRFFKKE